MQNVIKDVKIPGGTDRGGPTSRPRVKYGMAKAYETCSSGGRHRSPRIRQGFSSPRVPVARFWFLGLCSATRRVEDVVLLRASGGIGATFKGRACVNPEL